MTSTDWIHYIQDAYSTEPEHPWAVKPEFSVFRHASNKKWFALFMTVKASLLGLPGAEEVPVLNLKADPRLIGPQRENPGFFPAYHMNKEHWITAALDGSAPEDEIKILLAMSYDLTAMTRHSFWVICTLKIADSRRKVHKKIRVGISQTGFFLCLM